MSNELSRDEVAALIHARKILKARGLAKDIDVNGICKTAGISRKTGYQWADKLKSAAKEKAVEGGLFQEIERLKAKNAELEKRCDDLEFENEGRKLAWEIHGIDEFIAKKKRI
jgi:hypothetical protein